MAEQYFLTLFVLILTVYIIRWNKRGNTYYYKTPSQATYRRIAGRESHLPKMHIVLKIHHILFYTIDVYW